MISPPDDERVEDTKFKSKGPPIFVRRGKRSRDGKAVLLIHGASASCDTFLHPKPHSLFDYLNEEKGFDVWLLDWRASMYSTAADPKGANSPIDDVAYYDIPASIAHVRGIREYENKTDKIAIVAHCMGSGCLAMAIGASQISPADVDRIVLSTIGLFYEVAWDGWAKVQDRVLERVADANPGIVVISPHTTPWPTELEDLYHLWPTTWGPPWQEDFFRRLAFLYGQAFLVSNLHPAMGRDEIRKQFGAVPFEFYRHGAQNILRGFAATVDAEGHLDRMTPNDEINAKLAETYLHLEPFGEFDITLLTGADNPLWHRDSIDRMSEWLSRLGAVPRKHVLDGYGHQDLWWGRESHRDVFPLVFDAIR